MQNIIASDKSIVARLVLFVSFLVGGLAIFMFGANTYQVFLTNRNALYEWGLTAAFLLMAIILRRSVALEKYWGIAYALFVAAFANAVNLGLGNWLGRLLPHTSNQALFLAIDKLSQALPIVIAIMLLTLLVGDDLGSIFLKKGNLAQGLRFGLISFGVFTAIFIGIAVLQAGAPTTQGLTATGISLDTLVSAIPWILVFIFANSLMEELWFRGIFLNKLTPLLGTAATILVTALVFGSLHAPVPYIIPAQRFIFPAIASALGLVNGYVMLKTGSVWGSVLFHAGYDLLVIIPILASG
jgi:membrane protease YdiL (CAAX protease family)